jgi:hypothetical protein
MRTTVRLDDGLLEDAKRLAAERGTTLGNVIEDALRERIVRARAQADSPPADSLRETTFCDKAVCGAGPSR